MASTPSKITYTYSRVSKDRLNLDNQERLLENWRRQSDTVNIRVAKEVISGRKMTGESLRQVWDDVCADKVKQIVVVAIDRLGRNMLQALHFLKDCLDHDVQITVLQHPDLKLNTPDGKVIFGVMFLLAEWELEKISQRTKDGLRASRVTCKACGLCSEGNRVDGRFSCLKCGGTEPRFKGGTPGKRWRTAKVKEKEKEVLRLFDAGFTRQRIHEMLKLDERTVARIVRERESPPEVRACTWNQ